MLTRDINLDWNQVPDMGQRLPAGIIQFRILDYEEKMSSAEGMDKDGNQKVAKYMIQAHMEALAPEEAVGCKRDEYFVLGSNDDPLMQKAETFYSAIGARSLKRMLADAQVPWSASLVSTLNSSKGAMFLMQVRHKIEKSRTGDIDAETGQVREFVGVDTGRTYKLAEMQPRVIPCGLPKCFQCKEIAEGGMQGTGMAAGAPVMSAPPAPVPPVRGMAGPSAPSMPSAPVMPSMPMAPVAPAPVFTPGGAAVAPVTPPQTVVAPQPVQMPPIVPMPTPLAQPVAAPPQGLLCKICGLGDIPPADFPAHVSACAQGAAAQAQGAFKQES